MKILLKNHFENALETLKANKLRTGLTMVGITIGVASITAILSLAHGANTLLMNDSATAANTIALVRSGVKPATNTIITDTQQPLTANTLTIQDVQALSSIPNTIVAPMAMLHATLTAGTQTIDAEKTTLLGTTQSFLTIANLTLDEGEFTDATQGVIIGRQLAIDLFGTEDAIGNVLYIRDEPLTVVGILKSTKDQSNYLGLDFDRAAILPMTVSKQFTNNTAQIQQIILSSSNAETLSNSTTEAEKILSNLHKGARDYHIITGQEITAPNSQLINILTTVVAIIAGISLVVGGISVMNIMLASVAERQREVGIRKAIGATNVQIINQFVIESAIIGLLGGILGYGVGLGSAFLLSMYLPFTPTIQWEVALLAIAVSITTAIMFGLYPAIRAAQKNPIETLRY